jgi:hypothetical protein
MKWLSVDLDLLRWKMFLTQYSTVVQQTVGTDLLSGLLNNASNAFVLCSRHPI